MAELTADEKRELDELFSRLYERIRQLASRVRWHGTNPTLNPTALVHEAYLKVIRSPSTLAWQSQEEVIGVFAGAMREILIDASRRKTAKKRIPAEALYRPDFPIEDVLTIDKLVEALRRENPRQARIVDCRFYLGLTVDETATILNLSVTTVEREWREARARLTEKLSLRKAAT